MRAEYITSENDEEMREILKGLEMLLSVPEGSMPCNRDFGISWSNLDLPKEELENEYATALIIKAAEGSPPRVRGKHFGNGVFPWLILVLSLDPL